MTQHEDRQAHEVKADELDHELDAMQERTDRLGDDIEDAGEDWERKKKDAKVPGAAGEPEEADGPQPETEYPAKREEGDGGDGEDLDSGRSLDDDDS